MCEQQRKQDERAEANRTALRYLFYWSAGITSTLVLNAIFDGPVFETVLPLCISGLVTFASGLAYWRQGSRV